jgi:hypothetical protein
LYLLAQLNNQYYLMDTQADDEKNPYVSGIYQFATGTLKNGSYVCGYDSRLRDRYLFQRDNGNDQGTNRTMNNDQERFDEQGYNLIFKVDMKCRKELAPIHLLKDPSYDDNEDGNEASIYTAQDSSPDLRLELEIKCRLSPYGYERPFIYKCLIQQNHTQQGAPVGTSEDDVIVSPICIPIDCLYKKYLFQTRLPPFWF